MTALLAICADRYPYTRGGHPMTGYHFHSIVVPFRDAASPPDLDSCLTFDFGNYKGGSDYLFNRDVLATPHFSALSAELGVSRALSFPLSWEGHDNLKDLHTLTQKPAAQSPFVFGHQPPPDFNTLCPDDRLPLNCMTFITALLHLCTLSTRIGQDDLQHMPSGSVFFDRMELINEGRHIRLPGDLGQTFFMTADDGVYAYHDLPERRRVVDFISILSAGVAALAHAQGSEFLDRHAHPHTAHNPAVGAWLSHHLG